MAQKNRNAETTDMKNLLLETPDLIREIVTQTVQQILESEMDEALGAWRSERTEERAGHRSGYYDRSFITRVGKLELRIPQDRKGLFRTELFERYQRSEKALFAALTEMYIQGFRAEGEGDHGRVMRTLVQCELDQRDHQEA